MDLECDIMLYVAKLDRYDMVNNPMGKKPAFTIWFSGCHFHCNGCQNQELWDHHFGSRFDANELFNIIKKECDTLDIHDVVLLGGEPLDQLRSSLIQLIRLLHSNHMRIWLYTGYEFEDIDTHILEYLYTVKCGRYDENLRDESSFPITTNQRVFRNAGGWKQIDINKEDN